MRQNGKLDENMRVRRVGPLIVRTTHKPGGRLLLGLGLPLPGQREFVCGFGLENRRVHPARHV